MRTVITISLNGNAYQLDAVGYDALRAYLQVAEQRLAGNPDQEEILADLEQAIADKCNRYLGPHKNVIKSEEVAEVLREMGPVDGGAGEAAAQGGSGREAGGGFAPGAGAAGQGDATGGVGAGRTYTPGEYAEAVGETWTADGAGASTGGATSEGAAWGAAAAGGAPASGDAGTPGATVRRLYQIRDGAVISGVCKGLAAYLNIDVAVIRTLFVVLAIVTGGAWVLVYIVMMFVIPFAQTSEQHAAAHGWPFNAEEVIARAKSHYAAFKESEKWRRQQSREQRRMWKDQRKQWRDERRAWERAGSAYGAPPPPPPPPWSSAPPPNATYSSQVANGVMRPVVNLFGVVFFILFITAMASFAMHHRIFGWSVPWEMPTWVGIVALILLYQVVAEPLRHARYSAYYGAPLGQGWLALFGALIWLATIMFVAWLAWHHWTEVQGFFEQFTSSLHDLMDGRPAASPDPVEAVIGVLPGVPSCLLHLGLRSGELESHGEIDSADMFGNAAD